VFHYRLEIGPRDIENEKMVILRREHPNKETIDYQEETLINGSEQYTE
jgi:prolyl-tRNA synthetase